MYSKQKVATYALIVTALTIFIFAGSCGGSSGTKSLSTPRPLPPIFQTELTIGEEIMKAETPSGVDEKLFKELKEELIYQLVRNGISLNSKTVSAPPVGNGSKVDDLTVTVLAPGQWSLQWSYQNQGDGTEDGVVDIRDVKPIADNFFGRYDNPSDNPMAELADYNNDKVVDIREVAPLASNFRRKVDGYKIQMREDGSTTYTDIVDVTFAERSVIPEGRDIFLKEVEVTPPTVPVYVSVIPFDATGVSDETIRSNEYLIEPSPIGPEINSISPSSGSPGQVIDFTADVTGTPPFNFNWTFGSPGDGFNPETYSASGDTVTAPGIVVPTDPNTYAITLEVTDASGLSDTETFPFDVLLLTPPDITDIQPQSGTELSDVQFTPTVIGGTPPYAFQWTFPVSWTVDNPTIERPTATLGAPGDYQVSLQVSDKNSLTDEMTIDFRVNPGEPPLIDSITPDPFIVSIPDPARNISADVSGSEPLTFNWQFGTLCNPSSSNERQPSVVGVNEGTDTGSLSVSNPFGSAGPVNFNIDVGYRPFNGNVMGNPPTAEQGTEVTFTASAVGTGPFLNYTWNFSDSNGDWANPSAPSESDSQTTVTITGTPGPRNGTVAITNNYGTTIVNFSYSIASTGFPPEIISISPLSAGAGQTVDFSAQVTGTTPFNYTWTFGNPGDGFSPETYSGSGDTVTAPDITVPNVFGTYPIRLQVSNGILPDADETFNFTVGYDETEPNNSLGEANLFTLPETDFLANLGTGGYDGGTWDYFTFTASVGQILLARADYDPNAGDLGNAIRLRVRNSSDQTIATSYRVTNGIQILEWPVESSGTWYIRASITGVSTNYDYAMDVELKTLGTNWSRSVVDNQGDGGIFTSMAIANGNPAIIHIALSDMGPYEIFYSRNANSDGSGAWSAPQQITNSGDPANSSSPVSNLAIVETTPAFVYLHNIGSRPPAFQIRFMKSSQPDGSGSWSSANITGSAEGNLGASYSLGIAGGAPFVAYINNNGNVAYAKSNTTDGLGTWQLGIIDSSDTFSSVSLAIVGGNPAVLYTGDISPIVRYARNSQADGLGTWTTVDVDTTAGATFNACSLAVVSGRPAGAYIDRQTGKLYFARATTADGLTPNWTKTELFYPGFNDFVSLAIVGGLPAISAYRGADDSTENLVYLVNSAADGSGTWSVEWVDRTTDISGQYCFLMEVAGQPAVVYGFTDDAGLSFPVFSRKNG